MSELTLVVLRLALILGLWVLVISVVLVLRNDLFGTTVVNRSSRDARRDQRPASRAGAAGNGAGSGGEAPAGNARTDPEVTQTAMVVTAGPLRGTSLTLGSTPILIGRAPECTLVLDDDYASNRHARVFQRDGEWMVEDLGSTNGTLLSGTRIEGAAVFRPGAQVRIGRTEIELRRGPR